MKARLAGLVGLDLVWRVPELTPLEGAGNDLIIALFNLWLGIEDAPILEELTTWVLVGFAAVVLAPVAYPPKLGLPVERSGFQYSFAAVTIAFAGVLYLTENLTPFVRLVLGLAVVVLASGWSIRYLREYAGWTLSPEDERFVQLLDALFPTARLEGELRDDFARSGFAGILGAGFARLAAGVIVVVPAALSGIVALALINAYPLPEILVLAWLGLSSVDRVTERDLVPPDRFDFDRLDLESQLYELVGETTKSVKGMTIGIYLLSLAFGFATMFGVAVSFAARLELEVMLPWIAPRVTWGVFGFLCVVGASGCYGIWACFRMVTRLPTYLRFDVRSADGDGNGVFESKVSENAESDDPDGEAEETIETEREATEETTDTDASANSRVDVTRRPVGFVGPPLAAMALVATVASAFGLFSLAFAITWPLALFLLARCLLWTRRAGVRDVRHDDHHVVVGTALFVVGTAYLGNVDSIVAGVSTGQLALSRLPASVYVAGFVAWFGYMSDVFRYADAHDDVRRYLKSGYFLAFTIWFGFLTTLAAGPYVLVFYALLVVTGLAGLALFVTAAFRV